MALAKEIELPSGVTVRYHRVVSLNCITNAANLVEVASYTSAEKRAEERAALDRLPFQLRISIILVFSSSSMRVSSCSAAARFARPSL